MKTYLFLSDVRAKLLNFLIFLLLLRTAIQLKGNSLYMVFSVNLTSLFLTDFDLTPCPFFFFAKYLAEQLNVQQESSIIFALCSANKFYFFSNLFAFFISLMKTLIQCIYK